MPSLVTKVTDQTFEQEVLKSDKPCLVHFWAVWCGPCRQMAPPIDALASSEEGKLKVFSLDVDNEPKTTARYGVRSVPTMMMFRDGDMVASKIGAISRQKLEAWVEENM